MPSDLPHPGELLAGYRIERQLGHGATGVVFLARQVALDRPVALKVVGAPFAVDEAFRERFRREARAAAALDHPNVVTVLDSGEDDERLWLAMRLVDGPDLRVLLRRTGRLEPAHAVSVVEQVAAALDAADAAGLVHRDVKPGNVLVEDAPGGALHAELADFGLAGGPARTAGDDGEHVVEGTPEYAAPEQLAGQEVTAAADVYALGRVFAEMLTGDPAAAVDPGATGFAAVVARATDPDPAWRYPTAGALAVAARAVLEPARSGAAARARPVAASPAARAAAASVPPAAPLSSPSPSVPSTPRPTPAASGVAGSLPSPDEVRADAEYEEVAPLSSPASASRAGRGRRRATTLVASPRRRRRRWGRMLPLAVLLGVVAAAALFFGELRDGMLDSDPVSGRHRASAPTVPGAPAGGTGTRATGGSAAGTTRSGSGSTGSTATGPRESASDRPAAGGDVAGSGADGTGRERPGSFVPGASAVGGGSQAPTLDRAGPSTPPTDAAFPPARGRQRFGGGSWALDLPASAGWRQTAVQELSGGRTLLTRLRRADGARLVIEHRPGQTAVFGPWSGQAFVVRTPDAGRLDAMLFRGGRFAMCRTAVCAAVPVNGASGGVLLVAAAPTDVEARRALRRASSGLRVG